MSVLWGSALIIFFSQLRRRRRFIDICSITGIVILYVFCAVRILVPIELPWTVVVPVKSIYNPLFDALRYSVAGEIKVWHILLVIWGIGTAISGVLLIRKYAVYRKRLKGAQIKSTEISGEKYGISKNDRITIFTTKAAAVPFCSGVIDGYIIIPDGDYSEKDFNLIVKHELAHIRNGDLWIQLFTNILCVIYWWNPAVYIYRKNLEQCFELRCDRAVVEGMNNEEIADYLM